MSIQNALNLTATGIVSHNGSGVFAGRTISVTASTGISVQLRVRSSLLMISLLMLAQSKERQQQPLQLALQQGKF